MWSLPSVDVKTHSATHLAYAQDMVGHPRSLSLNMLKPFQEKIRVLLVHMPGTL